MGIASYTSVSDLANAMMRDCCISLYVTIQKIDRNSQVAVYHGQIDSIRFLLAQGVDPEIEDAAGRTPYALALWRNDRSDLVDVFARTVEDVQDSLDFSILHTAASGLSHTAALTSELLETEFREVDVTDRIGMTALHWASLRGDVKAMELLLRYVISLHHALLTMSLPVKRISYLVPLEKTMLIEARTSRSWDADIKKQDTGGWTCLHYACESDNLDAVALLLHKECNPNVRNRDGCTPMFYTSSPDVIGLLAEHNAQIELRLHSTGRTVLLTAAVVGWVRVIEKLVSLGADLDVVDATDDDALSLAVVNNKAEVVSLLLSLAVRENVSLRPNTL